MIILNDKKFVSQSFENEEELENVVIEYFEYIFGPDAILLPKKLIKSAEGSGTIPDGFAIDIASQRWFIVEAELAAHGVWSHIAPQVAKQIIAAQQDSSHQLLSHLVIEQVKSSRKTKELFEEHGIPEIDIRHFVEGILKSTPIVGLPIDHVGEDLRQWARTLKNEVKLWTIRKLVDLEDPTSIVYEIPDEYRPTLDTSESSTNTSGITVYDVSVLDLIEAGLIVDGETFEMQYKPRGGEQKSYFAEIQKDGSMVVLSQQFTSPSYAALHGINDAGSNRSTVNGWTSWKSKNSKTLAEIRKLYLAEKLDND